MTQATRKQLAVIMGLAVVTLAVYWPATGFDFINYDDDEYFSSNPHVLGGLTWENLAWAFRLGGFRFWHPLTWLSLMLDVTLFGRGAGGPHLTNLLLHLVNVLLLFVVLRRWTGEPWRSAVVAGLFALHPLRVESVAWIAERKDVLSTLFLLLTLWAYGKYVSDSPPSRRFGAALWHGSQGSGPQSAIGNRQSAIWYVCALLFFALGLMCKPMLVTLPFALLLLDYWPLRRVSGADPGNRQSAIRFVLGEKIPFFLLSAGSCAMTFLLHRGDGAMIALADFPISGRIENAFVSYARYLGKTFWPVDLALPYLHPGRWPLPLVVFAVALVAGLCLAAFWQGRRRPYLFVGWFWFWGTLVPVIGLAQAGDQVMADRFTYVPLIGVFLALVWGTSEMLGHWRVPKTAIIGTAVLVLGACGFRTRDQLQYWQNGESLFRHTAAVTDNNFVACHHLGTELARRGEMDEAQAFFREAIRIRPNHADAHNNLGIICFTKGNLDEAVEHFRQALRSRPDYADAHMNLGVALVSQGKLDEAMEHYREVLRRSPDDVEAHCNLGIALARTGRRDEALAQFKEALRLRPGDAVARQKILELGGPAPE